ncbi:hypothetical protein LFZ31_18060 [Salmonella enterica subsp. enterica serovar Newport str. S09097]|nr:hypothetical protein LFZ31_18060 [Salmonella enterica subsp. enterica serovar Newport str. S09097]
MCNCLILICSIQHQKLVALWTKKQLQALANELAKILKYLEDLSPFDRLLKKNQTRISGMDNQHAIKKHTVFPTDESVKKVV